MAEAKNERRRTGTKPTTAAPGAASGSEAMTTLERRPWSHPTGNQPRTVDIICLGPSQRQYHAMLHAEYTPGLAVPDETWTLNKGIRSIPCDLAFILDDLEGEERKSKRYADEIRAFAAKTPVITSELMEYERHRWPGQFHNYPLREILVAIGARLLEQAGHTECTDRQALEEGSQAAFYFYNSVPMILAYALFIGVKEIRLFGADYTTRDSDRLEENRPNAEFWVGFIRGMGVRVRLPQSTTLLNTDRGAWVYGYARQPVL